MAKIVRGYVYSEGERDDLARAAGIKVTDVHAAETKPPPKMRPNELLAVFDLTCFGDNRDDIAEAIRIVRAQGADIVEIASGRLCGDGAVMLAEALRKLAKLTPSYKARLQAALDTAAKRTGDGRCNADRLFELWGSPADIGEVVSKSGWPQSSIYTHFAKQKITREMARLEMANRRKAKRKSKK